MLLEESLKKFCGDSHLPPETLNRLKDIINKQFHNSRLAKQLEEMRRLESKPKPPECREEKDKLKLLAHAEKILMIKDVVTSEIAKRSKAIANQPAISSRNVKIEDDLSGILATVSKSAERKDQKDERRDRPAEVVSGVTAM